MGTRDRIIQTGATIIHRKGFNNTGIKQILDETGIPKGSFYFYFKNKEDFGLQVVDHFNGQFEDMTRKILENTSMSPLTRLQTLLKSFMDFFYLRQLYMWVSGGEPVPGDGRPEPGIPGKAPGGHRQHG